MHAEGPSVSGEVNRRHGQPSKEVWLSTQAAWDPNNENQTCPAHGSLQEPTCACPTLTATLRPRKHIPLTLETALASGPCTAYQCFTLTQRLTHIMWRTSCATRGRQHQPEHTKHAKRQPRCCVLRPCGWHHRLNSLTQSNHPLLLLCSRCSSAAHAHPSLSDLQFHWR